MRCTDQIKATPMVHSVAQSRTLFQKMIYFVPRTVRNTRLPPGTGFFTTSFFSRNLLLGGIYSLRVHIQ